MGKQPSNLSDTQYVEKSALDKKQHVLDLFYNTNFQTVHLLVEMKSLYQTKNYDLDDH